ncbi:deoxycytidylate deaminase (dCMP deaminase) [Ceratobasidium sp. AG-Ba]|nr:deoxycytidylate deaminase (dCMP deaminase) [Ceratobasidium sp. AG-Ba]
MSSGPRALTPEEQQTLIQAAIEGKSTHESNRTTVADRPYSKFRVGAALFTTDGRIIKGANIENASYGGTICAERTALVKAVSEGTKTFLAIAVTTDVKSAISPCGICRQFIREFCSLSTPILMVSADYTPETAKDTVKSVTLGDILPYSFGPEDLDRPREPE